jgi:hypothetical protein
MEFCQVIQLTTLRMWSQAWYLSRCYKKQQITLMKTIYLVMADSVQFTRYIAITFHSR